MQMLLLDGTCGTPHPDFGMIGADHAGADHIGHRAAAIAITLMTLRPVLQEPLSRLGVVVPLIWIVAHSVGEQRVAACVQH
ncbi:MULTISPECIES: hypothetical protein [Bradyrhizobium]|uniref:hypothetical protein n=1 Tax=Bradyrhizobium brasilense TaxID=1419277 RepID=UPI0028772521|nr:hypothetical protein [Bradyrhizobium brasilense]MCP3416262.1 hypothetical protein [Bradyrhizobium brasilense]